MKELTKAEEQVMQVLWQKGKTSVNAIVEEFPEPRPAYNTVSTIVRILEKKGFVDHEPLGKGYIYYTTISKTEYTQKFLRKFVANYFDGSFKNLVSFFVKENRVGINDVEAIMAEIRKDLQNPE
ncbi:MAG: BlaI/MecI/CopY family transcriptional regulator [Bacteroidales bacterium]|nr:BlaI/MecI/CopY family transcriptional regulator [Bacteroidales bacterium]